MNNWILYIGGTLTVTSILGFIIWKQHKIINGLRVSVQSLVNEIPRVREETKNRVRGVMTGQGYEKLFPFMKDCKYVPNDMRFLGSPLDFVVFDGLTKEQEVNVVFLEIKTGKSALTAREKAIRDAIDNKRITFECLTIEQEKPSDDI